MDRRISKTAQEIDNAFFTLLADYPADKITIRRICERANINRATFYNHYENYPAFLRDVKDRMFQECMRPFERYHFDKNTDAMIRRMLQTFKRHKKLLSLLFRDDFADVKNRCIRALMELTLPQWLEKSCVSAQETKVIFTYMINGLFAMLQLWTESDFSIDEERMRELIANTVESGVFHYIYTKLDEPKAH